MPLRRALSDGTAGDLPSAAHLSVDRSLSLNPSLDRKASPRRRALFEPLANFAAALDVILKR